MTAFASPFVDTLPPVWADGWGRDEFGFYAEFSLPTGDRYWEVSTQRMRWIPPGVFSIGSPDDEPERWDDEGPRHEVTITRGFWLADTTCTQELWQLVMGGNPSQFQDPDRPVEKVSFHDVEQFLSELSHRVPGLQPQLPTEAQWEYACRAGTTTPFSFGDQITTDLVNYDGNYPYAGRAKGDYREQTIPCKALPPNDWGLYQMHGNVWEWCQDWSGSYSCEPQRDPTGPAEGSRRVVRGGSWFNLARYVRSAYRDSYEPGSRLDSLGFRLLSSVSTAGSPASRRTE